MALPNLGGLLLGPPTGPQCKRAPPRYVWDDDWTTDEDSDEDSVAIWWKRSKPEDATCPMPSAGPSEALDEGSAGPIYPEGSGAGFVETPSGEEAQEKAAALKAHPPRGSSSGTKIKARFNDAVKNRGRFSVIANQRSTLSVYAQKSSEHADASQPVGVASSKAQALKARVESDDYYAYPDQLYPLNHPLSMGVAVYKVLDNADENTGEVAQWRGFLKRAVNSAPEFKERPATRNLFDAQGVNLAVGGFAALAHPSSFHNEFARALRFKAEHYVVEKDIFGLGDGGPNAGKNLEQIVDRTMIRRPEQTPTAELWHRDIARGTMDGDEVFGGWINLDTANNQYFSCVPGSSDERPNAGVDYEEGFAKIASSQFPEVIARSYRIVIPPGHMVVFNERTIHEVAAVPNTSGTSSCRLFFGWRLTHSATPLFYDVERRLVEQDGMPLKSGQHKHAYSDPKCGGRYKEMKAWNERNGNGDIIFSKTNTLGFKNYPGGPPMYPSAYWGQLDPKFPRDFCASLRPCLLKQRYFNPVVYTGETDSKGNPKTRAPKYTDDPSTYKGDRFHSQQRTEGQSGVLCNFDLKWDDGQDGNRTHWSFDMKAPLKPDTMRSLAETECALSDHPEGQKVRWMQRPYDPIEIGILKPTPFRVLKERITKEETERRGNPNIPVLSPRKY